MPETLTIAYIAGDDAAYDGLFALSLRQSARVADQIVVIDSSAGETVEYAAWSARDLAEEKRQITFSYRRVPWQNDYALQRNIALGWSTSDWVLFVDADELIDDRFVDGWPGLLQEGKRAYLLPTYNFVNKPGEGLRLSKDGMLKYPDKHARLMLNERDLRFGSPMHEQPGRTILDVTNGDGVTTNRLWWPEDEVGELNMHIHHFGWTRSPEFLRAKLTHRRALEQAAIVSGRAIPEIAETTVDLESGPWADRQVFRGKFPALWDEAALEPRDEGVDHA